MTALRITHGEARILSAFVQGQLDPAPPLEQLRRYSLSAYAYQHLGPAHPLRQQVRGDFRALALRRQVVLAELVPLLSAWQAADIRVLVFKGFYLSEFVYQTPTLRSYGDIDVLIGAPQSELASRLAQELGYRETWSANDSLNPYKHELFQLVSPSGQVTLDVHARMLHNTLRGSRRQQRITEEVWQQAVALPQYGVYGPAPIDALLVGLILNRLWVPEEWTIKPQDLLDFRALVDRSGLTESALMDRARYFGCTRTVRQFLSRCDGFANRIDLRPSTPLQRARWDLQLVAERGSITGEYLLGALGKVPGVTRDLARELPGVLEVLRRLRSVKDIPRLLALLTPAALLKNQPSPTAHVSTSVHYSRRQCQQIVRGVHLSLALMRVRPGANCLPRSLAIYASLRRAGLPAVFCAGVRRAGSSIESHAWVELGGAPIDDPYIHENPGSYRVNLRYPENRYPDD